MTIALVQAPVTNHAASTTVTATLGSNATAGNCLVAVISVEGSVVSSVKLGGAVGNWALVASIAQGSDSPDIEIWADPSCAGGSAAVLVTIGTSDNVAVAVYEFSGVAATSILDKSSTGSSAGSTAPSSGTTATTTQAIEAWIGGFASISSGTSTGPASPWTNTATVTQNDGKGHGIFLVAGYQITTATGAATYSGTTTNSAVNAGVVVTLLPAAGGANPAGTVQPPATVPVPRRKPRRAQAGGVAVAGTYGQAPAQEYRQPARRKLIRALVRFVPVTTTNAIPPTPTNGTVQPPATVPLPRRKPARAQARGVAVPGVYGKAPAQEYQQAPRRRLARALLRFVPVATTNALPAPGTIQSRATLPAPRRRARLRAWTQFTPVTTANTPRTLIISLASKAGEDDYGNEFPEGILATAGEINGPTIIGSDAFYYSPSPAFGNLTQTVSGAAGTDTYGNAYLAGSTTYTNDGSFWSAVSIVNGVANWYEASGAAGPWNLEAGIGFSFQTGIGGHLIITSSDGVGVQLNGTDVTVPQFLSGSIQTLPPDNNSGTGWVSGERGFMNSNWVDVCNSNFAAIVAALEAAGITI